MFIRKQPRTLTFFALAFPLAALVYLPACGGDDDENGSSNTDCTAFCAKNMCPQDDNATCMMDCQAGADACPDESAALTSCQLAAPATAWSCDVDGYTAFDDTLCSNEGNAFLLCALSASGAQ